MRSTWTAKPSSCIIMVRSLLVQEDRATRFMWSGKGRPSRRSAKNAGTHILSRRIRISTTLTMSSRALWSRLLLSSIGREVPFILFMICYGELPREETIIQAAVKRWDLYECCPVKYCRSLGYRLPSCLPMRISFINCKIENMGKNNRILLILAVWICNGVLLRSNPALKAKVPLSQNDPDGS